MPRLRWSEQSFDAAFPLKERAEFMATLDVFYDRVKEAAKSGRDSAASTYLEAGNRWNPMIDAISTYANGAELDAVSGLDLAAYEDTGINWRVRRGYCAVLAGLYASVPLAFHYGVNRHLDSGKPRQCGEEQCRL